MAKVDSLGTDARELVDLVIAYAKQETVDPIKGVGKSIALGVLGAVLTGVGVVFLGLSALRALQTETTAFDGNWSFVPYLIVAFLLAVAAGVAWATLGPGGKEKGA